MLSWVTSVYVFVYVPVKGDFNNWKPEYQVCWRLVLVTCLSPVLTSLSVGRRQISMLYPNSAGCLLSPVWAHWQSTLSKQIFWLISQAGEHLLNQVFVQWALRAFLQAFDHRRALLCVDCCLLLSQSWIITSPKASIYFTGGREGEAFPLHWAQTCATTSSTSSHLWFHTGLVRPGSATSKDYQTKRGLQSPRHSINWISVVPFLSQMFLNISPSDLRSERWRLFILPLKESSVGLHSFGPNCRSLVGSQELRATLCAAFALNRSSFCAAKFFFIMKIKAEGHTQQSEQALCFQPLFWGVYISQGILLLCFQRKQKLRMTESCLPDDAE